MNKKIFTLLASTLMLFVTAYVSHAQPWRGEPVKGGLAIGDQKSAYQLKVVALGSNYSLSNYEEPYDPTTGLFLAVSEYGELVFRDGKYILTPDNKKSALDRLNETLWCINSKDISGAQQALFTFLNKYHGTDLSISTSRSGKTHQWLSVVGESKAEDKRTYTDSIILYNNSSVGHGALLGGELSAWQVGNSYVSAVADSFALRIPHPTRAGWYLTLAVKEAYRPSYPSPGSLDGGWNAREVYIVEAHSRDFDKNSDFYKNNLVLFALNTTGPRLLTAGGINTLLGLGAIDIKSDDIVLSENPLNSVTSAVGVSNYYFSKLEDGKEVNDGSAINQTSSGTGYDYYVNLRTAAGTYLVVKDEEGGSDYHDGEGKKYPKLGTTATPGNVRGRADFRLVYYPSQGTVVINVRQLRTANNPNTLITDKLTQYMHLQSNWTSGGPLSGVTYSDYYGYNLGGLFLLPQRITAEKHVVTAGGSLTSINEINKLYSIAGNEASCVVAEGKLTTIDKNDLYLIKEDGGDRYLTVPLYTGTYSPQWVKVTNKEDALRSPAFHWFVTKYEQSDRSKVQLVNREFTNIKFEYVQIYKEGTAFTATWVDNVNKDSYGTGLSDAKVALSGFEKVTGAYRQDPHLGYNYIDPNAESLAAGSYTLEYYNKAAGTNLFVGLKPVPTTDTLFYAVPDVQKTLFKLETKDGTKAEHAYGIDLGTYKTHGFDKGADSIAVLRRQAYKLKISDYLSADRNDRSLTLSNTTNYIHAETADAAASPVKESQFYLRYQFAENSRSYYTLLQRVEPGDFKYLADNANLTIANKLWSLSDNADADTFGVLQVAVDPYTLTIKAVSRVGTSETPSAFSFEPLNNPLYRRFNGEGLGDDDPSDNPRYLKFFRARSAVDGLKDYLYEDQYSSYSYDAWGVGSSALGNGIKFLGVINESDDKKIAGNSGTAAHSFGFYVDTAFVNRVGYTAKPQYLLAVNPLVDQLAFPNACPTCALDKVDKVSYTYARYLKNALDSAERYKNDKDHASAYRYARYNRLIFVDAVHAGDYLYILNTQTVYDREGNGVNASYNACIDTLKADYETTSGETVLRGTTYLNLAKLAQRSTRISLNTKGRYDKYVFSFRFADQTDPAKNSSFFIESESTNAGQSPLYGPTVGGWLKLYNGYVVISRKDATVSEKITEAEEFDVESATEATANAPIETSSSPEVISGSVGSVTVLNASGKRVVLTNVLGQTISKSVLTSDRAVLSAPRGVVIVSVEGEGAVKAIVK